jgi:hypothetical protein
MGLFSDDGGWLTCPECDSDHFYTFTEVMDELECPDCHCWFYATGEARDDEEGDAP